MSRLTRTMSNLPNYYHKLTTKQKRNWRRNTRKIENNESLRTQYPAFHSLSKIDLIHVHYQSTPASIEQLIIKAKQTKLYVMDTECQKGETENQGALIQIQFIHSIDHSTIIIIETNYLPAPETILFKKIGDLCNTIFNNNNGIISWGPITDEFKEFRHLNLINISKITKFNLQSLFSNPDNEPITHPEKEKRDEITGWSFIYETPGDDELDYDYDDEPTQSNSNQPISLQNAVAITFNKFLDKSLTVNHWKCGIDLSLNTWRTKLFSRNRYDQNIEQQERNKMLEYAINDCTSVAELFLHMYPEKFDDYVAPHEPAKSTINDNYQDNLVDVSDEEIEIYVPRFDKKQVLNHPDNPPVELTITTTQQEMDEINFTEQPEPQALQLQEIKTTTTKLSKQERQRIKNEKFKLKKKYQPNFQNKIIRPIYHRYDYRKVRAQLMDDNIITSHQITINDQKNEVMIGFKSNEAKEQAKLKIKINYFSKDQYIKRWSGK